MSLENQLRKLVQINTAISRGLELLSMELEPDARITVRKSLAELMQARDALIEQCDRQKAGERNIFPVVSHR